jgi:glycosyltransferase involved in cell wall biosynthesis
LAEELVTHNIFLAPSEGEACSNAVLEAMACGLPVLYLNSGSHEEVVGLNGLSFKSEEEMVKLLSEISKGEWPCFFNTELSNNMNLVAKNYLKAIDEI